MPLTTMVQDIKYFEIGVNSIQLFCVQSFSKEDDLNRNAHNLDEKISDARSDKEGGTDKVRFFFY